MEITKAPYVIPKGPKTFEAIAITTLRKGQIFYTTKSDKNMAAIGKYYNKIVKTERLITVNTITGKTSRVVKVTITK